jgi:hypothetical protein
LTFALKGVAQAATESKANGIIKRAKVLARDMEKPFRFTNQPIANSDKLNVFCCWKAE